MRENDNFGLSTCIGETVTGLPYPVFYDPNYPARVNKPPVTTITGAPGTGKTFLGLVVVAHASLLGKVGIVLDPKGDFDKLKNLEARGYINKIRLWTLAGKYGDVSDENTGILDPTLFYPNPSDNAQLTIDVITILVGGKLTEKQNTSLTPIVNDVTEGPSPSFEKVVGKLLSNRNDEVRSLGYSLESILKTSLSKLIVKNKRAKRKVFTIKDEIVVVNLQGLKLPQEGKSVGDLDSKERLSTVILSLIGTSVSDMMFKMEKSINKILVIDEAWNIINTKIGKEMVMSTSRLGRSLNLATILLTQSGKHFDTAEHSDLRTMVSVRFAFSNNDEEDNIATTRLMQLPEKEGWEQAIRNLETGVCLLQNTKYETSFIHIMAEDEWVDLFRTNPTTSDT